MPVKINGATSGGVTLDVPAAAGTNTATFPASTGNVVLDSATQTLTNKTLTNPVINGMGSSILTSDTAKASTSGTNIDFTGIPSWVKRITVMFNAVSMSGTDNMLVQLGTSGGLTNSGYTALCADVANNKTTSTAGFLITRNGAAGASYYGSVVVYLLTGNTWVYSSNMAETTLSQCMIGGGAIALSGALTQLRILGTTTNAFDAGSINILYE